MKLTSQSILEDGAVTHIHAVGVGGMGLGPLAIYLAARGWKVSGEDDAINPRMRVQLTRAGVQLGASGTVPEEVGLLIYSSAVRSDHALRSAARERGLPTLRRGEALAALAAGRRLVGVCGSHGKTSVTAMVIALLRSVGWKVDYVLGGLWTNELAAPAQAGDGEWLVAEIDESDGTIERFAPAITALVNLDWDHADHYESSAKLRETFQALMGRTTEMVMGWDQCRDTALAMENVSTAALVRTYGRSGDFKLAGREVSGADMTLELAGDFKQTETVVRARGEFNALNATLAWAVVETMGARPERGALARFEGVRRRQAVLRSEEGLTVIEDYAHHPAEVSALLASLRQDLAEGERLVVVFQPHRFSRTRQFKAEFAAALAVADSLHLLDVYGAGEDPLTGGTTADLHTELVRIAPKLPVNHLPGDADGGLEILRQSRKHGDWVIFVGAGDIERHARRWLQGLDGEIERGAEWDAWAKDLKKLLASGGKVSREEPLASKTTLRVGGAARVYVEPATVEELQAVVKLLDERGGRWRMLGRGSNLLVPDAGVDAVVISLRRAAWETFEELPDSRLRVGAGLRLKALCGLAAKAGRQGFEFLEGIPGNVGGALRMNAGAMGGWMFDVVEAVEILTTAGERVVMSREDLHVGYRHCAELREAIAIGAVLRVMTVTDATEISRQIDVYRSKRQESQPREPSAGCIFKNPDNDSAGRLIDQCGFKGERIGDAEVSVVHGNFIINRGKATSAEVVALVKRVRSEVKRQTGVSLQPEVLFYGCDWEDVL